MNRIWGHRWTVGIAAMVLVLALGAVAWAATDDGDEEESSAVLPALGDGALFGLGEGHGGMMGGGFMGRGHGGMMDFENLPEEFQQRLEERRQAMEERQQAFLDLVREKMTEEERNRLDNLLDEAETKREALDQAREDLQSTTSEIRELIGKYFPLGSLDDSGTTSTTITGTTTQ